MDFDNLIAEKMINVSEITCGDVVSTTLNGNKRYVSDIAKSQKNACIVFDNTNKISIYDMDEQVWLWADSRYKLEAENEKLKAEVEKLEAIVAESQATIAELNRKLNWAWTIKG